MNLIELYIVEVHSVRECEVEGVRWVEIDATTNGYGNVSLCKHICRDMAEWVSVTARVYFLG